MPRTIDDRKFPYYPAFLDLRRKRVVVVGGGEIATGKVRGLLPCGPEPLVVIAPDVSPVIREAGDAGQLIWHERPYREGDLADVDLVFAATDDRALNATVAAEARRRRIPVLAVDDIPNCDLIAPSIVKRGDLTIAFSTNGRSPAFARWLRERFDRDVPAHWGELLDVAGTVRDRLGADRARIRPEEWLSALDELNASMDVGELAAVEEWLLERLRRGAGAPHEDSVPRRGFVSLVGAGPGDPELLTVRALKRLRDADVVVHDRLIGAEILSYCRPDAERRDVGKSSGGHSCQQQEINELLVSLGRSGLQVVRLKGGDPFVFGRGGEEAMALAEAEIPFEVVPGISSALAVPEVAGIPVTHRGLASSVTIATGHGHAGGGDANHDWSALARIRGTLVFLMAVENLEHIVERLITYGRCPDEPTALVESGTTSKQRVIRAPLASAATTGRASGVRSPAVFVVGPTAALADQIGDVFPRSEARSTLTADPSASHYLIAEGLVRPHVVIGDDLEAEYRQAAQDVTAEHEAADWIEANVDEALD